MTSVFLYELQEYVIKNDHAMPLISRYLLARFPFLCEKIRVARAKRKAICKKSLKSTVKSIREEGISFVEKDNPSGISIQRNYLSTKLRVNHECDRIGSNPACDSGRLSVEFL